MIKVKNPSNALQDELVRGLNLRKIYQDENNITVEIKKIAEDNYILLYSSSSGVNDILVIDATEEDIRNIVNEIICGWGEDTESIEVENFIRVIENFLENNYTKFPAI